MTHLQTIAEGCGPSEEHIRVLEAYRREFNIPISLPYSTAAFNRAVDWWNADAVPASVDAQEYDDVPFRLHEDVRKRLAAIDSRLLPDPGQIAQFDGYAAVGAALLAAVGSHALVESIHEGGRVERCCWTCTGKPAYPCDELRAITEALGVEAT